MAQLSSNDKHKYFMNLSTGLENEEKTIELESSDVSGITLTVQPFEKKKKKLLTLFLTKKDICRLKSMLDEVIIHQEAMGE